MKAYFSKILPFAAFAFILAFLSGCAKDEVVLTGSINGYVTDFTNANTPIAGASVTLSSKGLTKTTGNDGRFEFQDLEPGTYTLSVKANNYQSTTKQITVYAGQKANCDIQLEQEKISIDISPANLVFGKDVDQLSFSIMNNSNRDLTYTISNYLDYADVTPTTGMVKAKGSQAVSVKIRNRNSITIDLNGQIIVNIGSDSYPVSLTVNGTSTLATTGDIAGVVTDYANTNSPISGATVSLTSTGQTKTTSSDGRYEFKELTRGKYTLSVSANGYETVTKDVTVEEGKTTTCDFQLQKGSADVEVSPLNLAYAADVDQLSFTIRNLSNNALSYTIANVPEFAEVTSTSGMVAAKGSQAITVKILNRKQITTKRNGQLTVNVGDNAYVISLSVEPYKSEAVNVDITPQALNFDANTDQLSFYIKSNNTRPLDYVITSSLDLLTVSPSSGTIKEGGQNAINVSVKDHHAIDTKRTGQLTITIEENTFSVSVTVEPYKENLDVAINPTTLSFDESTSELSFDITSNNNRSLSYAVKSDLDVLTLSPSSGTISSKGKVSIKANVKDRNSITEDKNGKITVEIEESAYTVSVKIAKVSGSGGGGSGNEVTRGLQAYYNFNDGTADDSRNGYNGIFNGGTLITDTPNGKGKALFLKKGESVNIPYAPLDGKANHTISLWVKDFGAGSLFACCDNVFYAPSLIVTEGMQLKAYTGQYSHNKIFSTNLSNYQSDKWTMITVVTSTEGNNTEGTCKLYINGKRVDSGTSYTYDNNGAKSMIIGGNTGNISTDPMKVDNVRLYSVALKDDEVQSIYNFEK